MYDHIQFLVRVLLEEAKSEVITLVNPKLHRKSREPIKLQQGYVCSSCEVQACFCNQVMTGLGITDANAFST